MRNGLKAAGIMLLLLFYIYLCYLTDGILFGLTFIVAVIFMLWWGIKYRLDHGRWP